jgi:hypothetical protein
MPVSANLPPLQEFRTTMAKYAPNETLQDGHVTAWAVGKILEAGGKSLPDTGDVPTLRKALLNGLWAIPHGFDLGYTEPLQYRPNAPASPVLCWYIETIQGHRFVSDGNRTCAPYDPSLVS